MSATPATQATTLSCAGVGEFRDSNELLGDPDLLRAEMGRSGYLYLPGLVPPEHLVAFDRDERRILERAGWATTGDTGALIPLDRGAEEVTTLSGSRAVQRDLLSCESLHRLGHDPALLRLLSSLLDSRAVLRHPRPVARVTYPVVMNDALPTPPHQDNRGMQGAIETYTAWLAIDNCSRDEGALAVAEASHRDGLRPYLPVQGALVLCCESASLEGTWCSADFSAGDVVVFHSLAVHAALPNHSRSLRRSVDCRYQRAGDPVCATTVNEAGDLTWNELYEGWEDQELQRYWERAPLNIVPFDPSYCRS